MFSLLWPKPISSAELIRLESHKYSASGQTILEPLCQIYWSWLFQFVPPWISPNVLTACGLLTNLTYTLVLAYYCPTAREEAPSWALIMSAVGLLMYQCLDSLDGKQGRRIDQDTPLEELFDHGCDSLSMVFIAVGTCISCGLGFEPNWMFFCSFIAMFIFFCSVWQTYVSGTVHFGLIDATEGHMVVILMYLISAFGGISFWQTTSPVLGMKPYIFPVIGITLGATYSSYNNFRDILKGRVKDSSVANKSVLSPGINVGFVLTLAFIVFKRSSSRLFENHSCLYLLTFGMVMSKLTNKLLIVHMTKSTFPLVDTSFIGPILLFLNQCFDSFIDEHILLWIVLVFSSLDLAVYFTRASRQISSQLHLGIFTVSSVNHTTHAHHN
ncbi:cholinephosphotransferase 1-like [Antennarius striatus]|uniref:cholinephosphotransferase 1-like n=1 Tax=Antennarius striatus TaxID=241820 RepID=UPI0035AF1F91